MIIALVIKIASKNIMRMHHYRFTGKIFRQKSGGGIGLRLTGVMAKISMDRWLKEFRIMLVDENIFKVFLIAKYVNDINVVLE